MTSNTLTFAAALGVLMLAACDPDTGSAPGSELEFRAESLDGFDDAIANFLRDKVDGDLHLSIDYLDMLKGIAAAQGCNDASIDSYVISDPLITQAESIPRVVNTVCSDDRQKADVALFALSFSNDGATDLDAGRIEMFAWDNAQRRYVFYKTEHAAGGKLELTIEPEECAGCHLAPSNVPGEFTPMMPIMNELSAPWEHWSAAPISVSHVVDDHWHTAKVYGELAGKDSAFLKSAARLEQTIRTAYGQRVATSRLRERRNKPADVAQGMALLRPLLCDEQINYVTEDGSSGLLSADAVVDGGFHSAYFAIQGVGWPWEWWNDRILRLPTAGQGRANDDVINMMPVRGASMITYEKQMMGSRAIAALDVMQLRALDWQTPVLSEFRCDLWQLANRRIEEGVVAIEVADDARTSDLFPQLLGEILTIHPADFGLPNSLPESVKITGAEGKVVSLARASDLEDLVRELAAGSLTNGGCKDSGEGVCMVDPRTLGTMIEVWFKSIENGGREALHRMRDRRACLADRHFDNKPFIPDLPSEMECDKLIADPGPG